jgi:monoamine oxidase
MTGAPQEPYDVLIIGAGIAGLTAARTLAESGKCVLILEAQDRIGGRILTRHLHGETIELGAEFLHGLPPELWALIEEAGLATYEREGTQLCFEDGTLTNCPDSHDDAFQLLEGLEDLTAPDLSFAAYLDRQHVPAEDRPQIIGFVEGFNAADHHLASAKALGLQQQAEDETAGDRAFAIHGGYHQLPEFLSAKIAAAHGTLRLSTPVRSIHWQPGKVEAITDVGTFTAPQALITLPLGVLQANAVPFTPPLTTFNEAAAKLQMGQVVRFTLLFRERFWATLPPQPAAETLSFLFSSSQLLPVWWTQHPAASATLTGWVGGPRSTALASLSANALADHALTSLSQIFSLEKSHLESLLLACDTHDWQADPYARGAYSYIATGGLDAPAQMATPTADTLYFAGEHTDTTGHWGTVHAAIRSGHRAASQILTAQPKMTSATLESI